MDEVQTLNNVILSLDLQICTWYITLQNGHKEIWLASHDD